MPYCGGVSVGVYRFRQQERNTGVLGMPHGAELSGTSHSILRLCELFSQPEMS